MRMDGGRSRCRDKLIEGMGCARLGGIVMDCIV